MDIINQINNDKEERLWAVLCHALAILGYIVPLGNLLAPLLIWAMKKDEFPLVNDQGKEALNFQITISILYLISFVLMLVFIGFLLFPLLVLFNLISVIIAAIDTAHGRTFRYPFTFRFIK